MGSQFNNSKVSFSNDSLKLIEPNVGILLAAIDTSRRHNVCEGRERGRKRERERERKVINYVSMCVVMHACVCRGRAGIIKHLRVSNT